MTKIEDTETGDQITCPKCTGEYFFRNLHTLTWDCKKMSCNTVAARLSDARGFDNGYED